MIPSQVTFIIPQTDQDIKPWYLHRSPSSYHRLIRTSCHDTRTGHHHTTDRSGHHAMTPAQVTVIIPQTDQDIKPWYLHRSPSSYHRPIRTSCHDTRTGHHHTTDRSGHHAMTPSQVTFIMPQTDLHHSLHPYGILWLWRSFSMQVLLTGNLESYWPVTVLYCCNCL